MFDKLEVNGIKVKKVLQFGATPGFGKWKKYFPKEAIAHPAKMNLNLLEYLILNYTKEGDVILDPMMGTGSTIVLSMLNNRNAIGIDIEKRFVAWAKEAIRKVENKQTLTPKGKGIAICGDARKLRELLKEHEEEISHVLFSPPYASAGAKADENPENYIRRSKERYELMKVKGINRPETEPGRYSGSWDNIGNLPFVADCIVTSPPYEESLGAKHHSPRADALAAEKRNPSTYTEVNHIITSPPYEGSVNNSRHAGKGSRGKARVERLEKEGYDVSKYDTEISNEWTYSKSKENIGNKKKESYLEAMRLVYKQCHLILKSQGLMILILKNFIRNKSVVPLTEYTIKLCESVGFKLKERLLFKLPQKSFWRVLYEKKFPEVDTTDLQYEHIIIFEKRC